MTLGAYVKIFLDAVDASYSKSVRKGTVMSFLGALRGLASISHILLDTALEALAHTHPRAGLSEYAFNRDVEGMRNEFNKQMNDLEEEINKASPVEIAKVRSLYMHVQYCLCSQVVKALVNFIVLLMVWFV